MSMSKSIVDADRSTDFWRSRKDSPIACACLGGPHCCFVVYQARRNFLLGCIAQILRKASEAEEPS